MQLPMPPIPPKRNLEPERRVYSNLSDRKITPPAMVGMISGVSGFLLGAGLMFGVFYFGLMNKYVGVLTITQNEFNKEDSRVEKESLAPSKSSHTPNNTRDETKNSDSKDETANPPILNPVIKPKKINTVISDHEKITECINGFLKQQEQGLSGISFWKDPNTSTSFFAVRSWKILDFKVEPNSELEMVNVRIDSSNKGGSQITVVWKFFMSKVGDEWKISIVSGND